MWCFVHFDLEMCFAPQGTHFFRHLNFQKWSEHGVFYTLTWKICFAPQRRALSRHLNFQKWSETVSFFYTFDLKMWFAPQRLELFSASQLPKVVRTCCVLYLLTWKCASRLNGTHFFDISTSKSGPNMVCFTLWLGNLLRATTVCTFPTSQLPKVVRRPSVLLHFWLENVIRATTAWTAWLFGISTSKSGLNMLCFVPFDLEMCFAPQRRALFRHLNFQKWPGALLTWKCDSRHNRVHFFDMATSKSGPNMVCFVHFDLKMWFAPQRLELFRHLNFQKWSEHVVFCTFWLGNVLRATTACTFSTSQLPKVARDRQFFTLLTWKCDSRHNGLNFFGISTSKSGLNMVCFVHFDLKMCFAPQQRAIFHLSSDQQAPHPPL